MTSKICKVGEGESQFVDGEAIPNIVTHQYTIWNQDDPPSRVQAEGDLMLSGECPAVDPDYGALLRKDIQVDFVDGHSDQFEATVTWEKWRPDVIDEEFLSGSISTKNEKVYTPISHIGTYAPAGVTAISFEGLIGVNGKDNVDGVDVPISVMSFSIRRIYADGTFNLALLGNLKAFVGRVNSLAWRGFAPGEVLLTGVDGDDTQPDKDEITFSFQASENETNIIVPTPKGNITIPNKNGFDYIWFSTEPHTPAAGRTIDVPHTAHVEQVFRTADLNSVI